MQIIEKNKLGFLIWGTRSGYRTLLYKNIESITDTHSNDDFLTDISKLYKDDLYVINPFDQAKVSYGIKEFPTCRAYIKYTNIYENDEGRPGIYSISIIIDKQYSMTGERVFDLLNKYDEIFQNYYIVNGKYERSIIKPDASISFETFSDILDERLEFGQSSNDSKSVEGAILIYNNQKDIPLIFDYHNQFGLSVNTIITLPEINLKTPTKDSLSLIKQVKDKKATHLIYLILQSSNASQILGGTVQLDFEGKKEIYEVLGGRSTHNVVINDGTGLINYSVNKVNQDGFILKSGSGATTLQQIKSNGNKLIIKVDEKPHFIFNVIYKGNKLRTSEFRLRADGVSNSYSDAYEVKVHLDSLNEKVEVEVIPNDQKLKGKSALFILTRSAEKKEIELSEKPIVKLRVLDGNGKPITDRSEYEVFINEECCREDEINLDTYDSKIDFVLSSPVYGRIQKNYTKDELQYKSVINLQFNKSRNLQEFKWTVKEENTNDKIEGVNYKITISNGEPVVGKTKNDGVISGFLSKRDNSDVIKEEVRISLNKPGFQKVNIEKIESFCENLEMVEQKKIVTIFLKNDPDVLSKLKTINYIYPKQNKSKKVDIKNDEIKIEFPYNYSPSKGDKLKLFPSPNNLKLSEKDTVIDLFRNEKDLFSNRPFSIKLKKESKPYLMKIIGLLVLIILMIGGVRYAGIACKSTQAEHGKTTAQTTKGNEVPEEGQATDGDQLPEEGQATDGDQLPEEGQATDGDQLPEEGQATDGDQLPEEGQTAGGGQVPEEDPKKEELIEKVKSEIKTENFRSNLDDSVNKWEKELRDKYSYDFDDTTKDKIESYKLTAKAIYRIRMIRDKNSYIKDKNEYIGNMTDILFYKDCKYPRNYTKEQIEFLDNFYFDELEKAISIYEGLVLPDKCKTYEVNNE